MIRIRWQCGGCHMLWPDEVTAANCCYPDEVFLCGKRRRTKYGFTEQCRHWDKAEARQCQMTDRRKTKGK